MSVLVTSARRKDIPNPHATATLIAQLSQKRACPYSISVKTFTWYMPRDTYQQSSSGAALRLQLLQIPTPLMSSLLARASNRPRPRCCCCCCLLDSFACSNSLTINNNNNNNKRNISVAKWSLSIHSFKVACQ